MLAVVLQTRVSDGNRSHDPNTNSMAHHPLDYQGTQSCPQFKAWLKLGIHEFKKILISYWQFRWLFKNFYFVRFRAFWIWIGIWIIAIASELWKQQFLVLLSVLSSIICTELRIHDPYTNSIAKYSLDYQGT